MESVDPTELMALRPEVAEASALGAELLGRYRSRRPVRGVVVTDLLDPRPAYWRTIAPIPPTESESARLVEGREIHERLGRRLAPAAAREFRVRRDGIVGKIDILGDRPVEIKSTSSLPKATDDPRESRPSYVEQLAMYGALVDRGEGRLVVVRAPVTTPAETRVWDVPLGDRSAIRAEMRARATALRTSRDRSDPAGLPRCGWYDRGCPFRREHVCVCDGGEPALSGAILKEVGRPTPNGLAAEEIGRLLGPTDVSPSEIGRFRELAYPRRAYFDGIDSGSDSEAEGVGPGGPPDETWSALQALLEDGPAGEYELRHDPSGEPAEAIPTFRGVPALVKSSRSLRPVPADRLVADRPHYVLELALRCASLGSPEGWLLLGMERVPSEGDWIRAQHLRFGSMPQLASLLERRRRAIAEARQNRDPTGLPRCPRWMVERCPHRAVCGCAATPDDGRT
jgi:hypothetical protein